MRDLINIQVITPDEYVRECERLKIPIDEHRKSCLTYRASLQLGVEHLISRLELSSVKDSEALIDQVRERLKIRIMRKAMTNIYALKPDLYQMHHDIMLNIDRTIPIGKVDEILAPLVALFKELP